MRAQLRGIIRSCRRGDLVLSLYSLQDATREVASPPTPPFFLRKEWRARVTVIHLNVALANSMHKLVQIVFNSQSFSLGETENVLVRWKNRADKAEETLVGCLY